MLRPTPRSYLADIALTSSLKSRIAPTGGTTSTFEADSALGPITQSMLGTCRKGPAADQRHIPGRMHCSVLEPGSEVVETLNIKTFSNGLQRASHKGREDNMYYGLGTLILIIILLVVLF